MQKFLAAFFVIAGFSVPLTYGVAQATPASKTKTVKKPVKKTVKKTPVSENSQKETEVVNVAGLTGSHYNCELGNQFTVYKKSDDPSYINLQWRNKMHRMLRTATTTGADRYEDRQTGLVWINIPAKSMLLDIKKGSQLANECRNPEQIKALAAAKPN